MEDGGWKVENGKLSCIAVPFSPFHLSLSPFSLSILSLPHLLSPVCFRSTEN